MLQTLMTHWPQILAIIPVVMAAIGIVHAIMTKEDVRAATGWVGVMFLSPFLGAIIYAVAGINRIRRATISAMRPLSSEAASAKHERNIAAEELIAERYGPTLHRPEDIWATGWPRACPDLGKRDCDIGDR